MANYYQKALDAVFYANTAKLQELIDGGHFYARLLEDTGLLSAPLPIWRIPQIWEEAIGDVKTWSESSRYLIEDLLNKVLQVKDIFIKTFGIEFTPVDYRQYTGDFYASTPVESIEDTLWIDNIEEAYRTGARPIDVELYCAGVKFDFARAEELLKQGANPMATLDEPDAYLYDRIGTEAAFLSIELSPVWKYNKHNHHVDQIDMFNLVGFAAHENMFRLLLKYDSKEPETAENTRTGEFIYPSYIDKNSAIPYSMCFGKVTSFVLVLDASRAWLFELPMGEENLDNYVACISGYVKDFMAIYGGKTHLELAFKMHEAHCRDDKFEQFVEKVAGMDEFNVFDYRKTPDSSPLDRIPIRVEVAFKILDGLTGNDEKKHFLSQSKEEFCMDQHEGLGLWIRDTWIFGSEEENAKARERRKKCLRMLAGVRKGDDPEGLEDLLIGPPDIISDQFLHRYYDHLKRTIKKSLFFSADKD